MLIFFNPDMPLLTYEMVKKYGPIYKISNSKTHYVVVGNHDLIREVLIKQGRVFGGRPSEISPGLIGDSKHSGPYGKTMMAKTLSSFVSVMKQTSFTIEITSKLLQHFKDQKGAVFSPLDAMYKYNVGVMTNLLI